MKKRSRVSGHTPGFYFCDTCSLSSQAHDRTELLCRPRKLKTVSGGQHESGVLGNGFVTTAMR